MVNIDIITKYAMSMLNIPYKWGGQSPLDGLDCSGFIIQLLVAGGIVDTEYDNTADGLYRMAKDLDRHNHEIPSEGSLIFFGTEEKITHIGYALNNKTIIHAGGGSSRLKGDGWKDMAKLMDARIKIQPYNYRLDVVSIRNIFK